MIDISFVIPVYNAHKTITGIVEGIQYLMKKESYTYEIILVDDCSNVETIEILNKLTKQDNIEIYYFKKNQGQQFATTFGLLKSKGNQIITLDDNIDFDINVILEIIRMLNDSQIVDVIYVESYKKYDNVIFRFMYHIHLKILKLFRIEKGYSTRIMTQSVWKRIIQKKYSVINIDDFIFSNDLNVEYYKIENKFNNESKLEYGKLIRLIFNSIFFSSRISLIHFQAFILPIVFIAYILESFLLIGITTFIELLLILFFLFKRKLRSIQELISRE